MKIEPLPWPGYNTNARAKWIHALPLRGLALEMSGFWTTTGLAKVHQNHANFENVNICPDGRSQRKNEKECFAPLF